MSQPIISSTEITERLIKIILNENGLELCSPKQYPFFEAVANHRKVNCPSVEFLKEKVEAFFVNVKTTPYIYLPRINRLITENEGDTQEIADNLHRNAFFEVDQLFIIRPLVMQFPLSLVLELKSVLLILSSPS